MTNSRPDALERVHIDTDPTHAAALAACVDSKTGKANKADQIRYAAEHAPAPRTAVVRAWLDAYGIETTRSYASTVLSGWRRVRGLDDTGEQPPLTDELLAELDAAASGPTPEPADVPAPVAQPEPTPESTPEPERAVRPVTLPGSTPTMRTLAGVLVTVIAVLLVGVIVAPIALSSQDIIDWAGSATGLGLDRPWDIVTFLALDAAAAVCVGIVVYCAWRGESAGIFALLVWVFAGMSAFANWKHGTAPGAAPDAEWFFPAMSLAGPFLLEVVVRRVRKWVQEDSGERARHAVSFGFARWVPGVGALRETYGAWRLARLDGIDNADQAVKSYRELCPDGSIRVLRKLRDRAQSNN